MFSGNCDFPVLAVDQVVSVQCYIQKGRFTVSSSFILVSSPRFWVMGNNLGPFPEWHEGQEHAAQAVGGRGALHGVNF